jgi:CheY-like chemotaxis protein
MQVLTNLINNAMKFTPSGGSVTVRAALRGRDMLFAVDDTGPGIPADELPKVFDRFRQVRPEKYADGKKRVGTGLGLCISREIVQHYGGRIWVESEVGNGSSFCFTVPLQREAAATLRADDGAAAGAGTASQNGHTNGSANGHGPAGAVSARVVLLLEDHETAKLAARVGQAAGLDCRACKDVGDLFAAQERWSPDAYVVAAGILQHDDELLGRIRADGASKLLVYSPDHGLTAPSLLDSAELLVPSLRALVRPGASVLVVEDDEKYRGMLEFELQQAGYAVTTAAEGRVALARILDGGPDAVILDLIMPGMDGLAVLERLQASGGRKIPILVYTAMDDASVALAAKDLGATEVFRKDGTGKTVYTAVAARVRRVLGQTLAPGRASARSRGA